MALPWWVGGGKSLHPPSRQTGVHPHSEIFFLAEHEFDMFGNPVRPGKGARGRPPFEVTERNRNKVKMLLAMGWSHDRVANAIDCSLATLKRYFRAELKVRDQMRDRFDAERFMVVAERALDGVVGAQRLLIELIDRNDRMEAERSMATERKAKEPAMGKKQIDAAKARDADAELMAELDLEAQKSASRNVRH